jgi:hypothetical protein
MQFPPSTPRPELDHLMALAVRKYHAMSPEERAEMHRAQRRSWLRGEIGLEHPELTDEEIERRIDNALSDHL